jgi:hypothetical protein
MMTAILLFLAQQFVFFRKKNLSLDFSDLQKYESKNLNNLPTNTLIRIALSFIPEPHGTQNNFSPSFTLWLDAHNRSVTSQRLSCYAISVIEERGKKELKKFFRALSKELKTLVHERNCFELDRIIFPIGHLKQSSIEILTKKHPEIIQKIKLCRLRSQCKITKLTLAVLANFTS